MKTFAFDKDFVLDNNGTIILSDGVDTTIYTIKHRMRTILGEWFADRSQGAPWYDYILGQVRPDMARMRANLIILIAEIDGVSSVDSLELVIEDSTVKVVFEATLNDGTQISGDTAI
jgi:hypothetical protein